MRKGGGKQAVGLQWKPIKGFSRYELSEDGQIRRVVKLRTRAKGSLLKGSVDKDGYLRYTLIDDNNEQCEMLGAHRLVALTFIGNPSSNSKRNALHKNDDKTNNHWKNIYWGSNADNSLDMRKNGKLIRKKFEDNSSSKIDWATVNSWRNRYKPFVVTCKMLVAEHGGVTPALVWLVVKNKTWVK